MTDEGLPADVSDLLELSDRMEQAGKTGAAEKTRALAGRVKELLEKGVPANLPAVQNPVPSAPIRKIGGSLSIEYENINQAIDLAMCMSKAKGFVPKHLVGNDGACLGIVLQAAQWGLSPYAVAQKSYIVSEGAPVGYESQLIHAVILHNAPIIGRLKHEFLGEGEDRRCRVWARIKGEDQDAEFTSEPIRTLRPPTNDRGSVKGSPLWTKKPDLQLFYNASRDWARMHCPDVLLGAYTVDEISETIVDVTPEPEIDHFGGDAPKEVSSA